MPSLSRHEGRRTKESARHDPPDPIPAKARFERRASHCFGGRISADEKVARNNSGKSAAGNGGRER
jgi:hypothetical protein